MVGGGKREKGIILRFQWGGANFFISYYFESELFMYMTALQYTILVKLPPLFINLEVSPKYIHVQMLSRYPPCKQTQGLFSTMILYIVTLCLRYKVNL